MNIIETKNLTKRFFKFVANEDINIAVKQGEIRAIIGENGAGKTTLMNMLYGMIQPTSGDIFIKGKKVKVSSPTVAIENGVGMVHQHFKLVPSLTVYENIMLGSEITKFGLIDNKKERQIITDLIEKYNFHLNPDDKVENISIGAKQRVEILKMLYRDVDIIIFDEPTAVLTPQEVDVLITNLLNLQKQGKTIIIITHKLQEVKKLAHNITVIRRGKVTGTVDSKDATMEELARMMVGRDVNIGQTNSSTQAVDSDVVYEIKNLTVKSLTGINAVNNLSLCVNKGEIVGIAGVEGNGQTELAKTLSGMMTKESGDILLNGNTITDMWPDELRHNKIGIMPEDRYEEGLCSDMTVSDNLIAGYHDKAPVYKNPFFNKKAIEENKNSLVEKYDIRLSGPDPLVSELSGGNSQKIIVARELSQKPDFLLCCQPTRGVDVGSIETIHKQIQEYSATGKAVLLISSELSEIMALSDRIVVLFKGEIVGEFLPGNTTAEELGLYMTGAKCSEQISS